jgi:hypothetical protein
MKSKRENLGMLLSPFLPQPKKETYDILLSSITIIFYNITLYEQWIRIDSTTHNDY